MLYEDVLDFTATDTWAEYSFSAIAPANANYVTATLVSVSNGDDSVTWFDDISLTTLTQPTDLDGLARIVDGDCDGTATVDMGAYEFNSLYIGDFAIDCDINYGDLTVLALSWQQDNPAIDIAPFLNPDGIINLKELLVMANNWLESTGP